MGQLVTVRRGGNIGLLKDRVNQPTLLGPAVIDYSQNRQPLRCYFRGLVPARHLVEHVTAGRTLTMMLWARCKLHGVPRLIQ